MVVLDVHEVAALASILHKSVVPASAVNEMVGLLVAW